jgi:hypothetical protein
MKKPMFMRVWKRFVIGRSRVQLSVEHHFPIDHVRHLATLAQAALLKKFGKSDGDDFFAEIDFRHGRRFCR